jgi:hypothetical protein
MSAVLAPKKEARILVPTRMHLAEHVRRDWVVDAEEGTTLDEVLDPQFWAHMAAQMTPFNRVEVRVETGEWVADLIVINCGRNWAQMHLIAQHELQKRQESPPSSEKHDVLWKGPHLKFCVLRKYDGQMLQQGFQSRVLAQEWLTNYERSIGPV